MSVSALLPKLKGLPRVDKLRLMHFLVSELAKEEDLAVLEADGTYPLWTPYNAFDAATTLYSKRSQLEISTPRQAGLKPRTTCSAGL